MGTVSPVSQTDMKFLSFLLCVSLNALSLQSRNASRGLWRHQRRFARLWWTSTRTQVTETCEEEITTTCVQVSSTKHHSSKIVDRSSSLVETGVPRQIETKSVQHTGGRQVVSSGYSKREAQPDFVRKYSR